MLNFAGKYVWNISYLKCLYGTRFYNYDYECKVVEKIWTYVLQFK